MVVAATVLLIVWGALAFGAVYPWAYTPLLAASAVVGAAAFLRKGARLPQGARRTLVALAVIAAAVSLQLVPLPPDLLRGLSPSTDAFLRTYDLSYALTATPHALSIQPQATGLGLMFLAAFSLLFAGLVKAFSTLGIRRVATAIVAVGAILAMIGIVQKAVAGDHAYMGMKIYGLWAPEWKLTTPFGPFVNKNHFAGWMLMGLPVAIGLALATAERGMRTGQETWRSALLWLSSPDGGRFQLIAMAILLMIASLLWTKSRSGLAGLVIALMIASVVAGRRLHSRRARWLTPMAIAAMFLLVFTVAGGDVAARIGNQTDAVELRKNIWGDSARVIRDFPLAGTGLNTFGTAMVVYQSSERDKHFQEAHNDYLQLAVEGGALVALPVLAALIVVVLAIRRRFAAGQDDPTTYWLRVGAVTGLVAIAVQSLVEFSLQMPGNAVLCVVLLAMALHDPVTRRSSTRRTQGPV
jgi:O-antigen ligase